MKLERFEQLVNEDDIKKPDFDAMWKRIEHEQDKAKNSNASRRSLWRLDGRVAVSIVTACMLTLAIGAYVSPAFALYIQSFFIRKDVDPGLQDAAQKGFSTQSNASVTDKGITLKVMEVLADPSRVVLTMGVEKDGKELDASEMLPDKLIRYQEYAKASFYLKNDKGWYSNGVNTIYRHSPYVDLVFQVNETVNLDQLTLAMNVKQIGDTKGEWKMKLPIDMSKSLAVTKTIDINQQVETQKGLIVSWKNLVQTPTATRINLETSWTDEAVERIRNQTSNYDHVYNLLFHIEDAQGNIVASSKADDQKRGPLLHDADTEIRRGMKQFFQYSFVPLDPAQSYTLVLDHVQMFEDPEVTYDLDLSMLARKPMILSYRDSKLTLSKYRMMKEKDGSTYGLIDVDGYVPGELPPGWWTMKDERGKYLNIDQLYYNNEAFKNTNPNDKRFFKSYLKIKGLAESTQKVTLTYDYMLTNYPVENWKVAIPLK